MVGTFWIDSVSALWAMPPVRLANQRAACVGRGDVGRVGPVRVLLGLQSYASPKSFRFGRRCIAASTVCITSRITVRRDQRWGITHPQCLRSGWRTIAASHFSGRVSLVPGRSSP